MVNWQDSSLWSFEIQALVGKLKTGSTNQGTVACEFIPASFPAWFGCLETDKQVPFGDGVEIWKKLLFCIRFGFSLPPRRLFN